MNPLHLRKIQMQRGSNRADGPKCSGGTNCSPHRTPGPPPTQMINVVTCLVRYVHAINRLRPFCITYPTSEETPSTPMTPESYDKPQTCQRFGGWVEKTASHPLNLRQLSLAKLLHLALHCQCMSTHFRWAASP